VSLCPRLSGILAGSGASLAVQPAAAGGSSTATWSWRRGRHRGRLQPGRFRAIPRRTDYAALKGASTNAGVAAARGDPNYLISGVARTRAAGRAAEPALSRAKGPDRGPCATKFRPPLPSRGEGATLWPSRGEGPLSAGHRTHRKPRDVCATRHRGAKTAIRKTFHQPGVRRVQPYQPVREL
jgi:hypothetical protein